MRNSHLLKAVPCSHTYFSYNPTSLRHGLKIPLQGIRLRRLLSVQSSSSPYRSPPPSSFHDSSLIFSSRKSCTRQVVPPPKQSFKSSYLPQRAALVPIWRKGRPDRWPVFSRLERMKNATGGKKIPVIFFAERRSRLPTSLALGGPPRGMG